MINFASKVHLSEKIWLSRVPLFFSCFSEHLMRYLYLIDFLSTQLIFFLLLTLFVNTKLFIFRFLLKAHFLF